MFQQNFIFYAVIFKKWVLTKTSGKRGINTSYSLTYSLITLSVFYIKKYITITANTQFKIIYSNPIRTWLRLLHSRNMFFFTWMQDGVIDSLQKFKQE